MDSETPSEPTAGDAAPETVMDVLKTESPFEPARESAHERHVRELEQSLGTLEDTVEHGIGRILKVAIPLALALLAAAVGVYILGGKMRDRSEARHVARAMRRAARAQTSS